MTAAQTSFTYFVDRLISWQDFVTTGS